MSHLRLAISLMALVAVLLPLGLTGGAPPIYDDRAILAQNEFVRARNYSALWTTPFWTGDPRKKTNEGLYRPLFLSTLTLFQNHLFALKLLVALSHALASVLVGLFVWRFTHRAPLAAIAAGLSAFHPANVEVTAQGVGLMESMSTFCGLAGLFWAPFRPALALAFSATAPGWKEPGLLWLLALAIYFVRDGRKAWGAAAFLALSLWLGGRLVLFGGTLRSQPENYAHLNPLSGLGFESLVASQLAMVGHQVRLLFFPIGLTHDYSQGTLPLPGYWAQVWVVLALLALALLARYRRAVPFAAWIGLFTVALTLDLERLLSPFGERFGYGFRMGALMALTSALALLGKGWEKRWGWGACALLCGIASTGFTRRHLDWRSAESLFRADVRTYPNNPKLHYDLAMELASQGRWEESLKEFLLALELSPFFPEAHYRVGIVYWRLGDQQKAMESWGRAQALGFHLPK